MRSSVFSFKFALYIACFQTKDTKCCRMSGVATHPPPTGGPPGPQEPPTTNGGPPPGPESAETNGSDYKGPPGGQTNGPPGPVSGPPGRGPPPSAATAAQTQKMLDENSSLISTISEYQKMGRHNETMSYQVLQLHY